MSDLMFYCGVCKKQINPGKDGISEVIEVQRATQGSGLMTYYVESECNANEVHLNLIVVDSDEKYRGIKHSEIRPGRHLDDSTLENLGKVLRFGNDLAKAISVALRGESLAICGEEEDCIRYAHVLERCFAIDTVDVRPWVEDIEAFVKEYSGSSELGSRVIALFDSGLIRQVSQTFKTLPRMELRNRSIHNAEVSQYAVRLLKILQAVPQGEIQSLKALLKTQLDSLQKNLNALVDRIGARLTETMILKAGDMSEVDIINQILDQMPATEDIKNIRTQMKEDELEVLAPHLVRRIPALRRAIGIEE